MAMPQSSRKPAASKRSSWKTALLVAVAAVCAGIVLYVVVRARAPGADVPPEAPPRGEAAPDAAPPAAAERTTVAPSDGEQPVGLGVRGVCKAPSGAWPGGGRIAMFAVERARGVQGMVLALSRLAREGATAGEFADWIDRDPPVRTADVDASGAFAIADPPLGRYRLLLEHPTLQLAAPLEVAVLPGEERDLGEIATRGAAALLVLVADGSGRAIEKASVHLYSRIDPLAFTDPAVLADLPALFRRMLPRVLVTDERGTCRFEGLEPHATWTIRVTAAGFAQDTRPVAVAAGADNLVRVDLVPGARLRVHVVDEADRACAGARFHVRFPDAAELAPFAGLSGSRPSPAGGTTDADGTRELEGLPLGRAVVDLETPGFLPRSAELQLRSGEVSEVALRLERGAAVTGRVVGESGAGVAGAHVMHVPLLEQSFLGFDLSDAVGLDLMSLDIAERGVACDASGGFVLGGFEHGQAAALVASAPGYEPAQANAVAGSGGPVEIVLLTTATLTGAVTAEPDGSAVSDFTVSISTRSLGVFDRPVAEQTFSGAAGGTFALASLPRDTVTALVRAPGRAPWSSSLDLRSGAVDLGEIRLQQPATIEGVVVDPEGAPLEGVSIRIARGGPGDLFGMAAVFGSDAGVLTDRSGRFSIGDLAGRSVRLLADKAGFAPLRTRPIRIAPGESVTGVLLELGRGGSIRGRVVFADGTPPGQWHIQASHASGLGTASAVTDAEGAFRLVGLAAGTHKVDAFPIDRMQRLVGITQRRDPQDLDFASLISEAMHWVLSDRVVVRDGEEVELTFQAEPPETEDEAGTDVTGSVRLGERYLEGGMMLLLPPDSDTARYAIPISAGRFRASVRPGAYLARVQPNFLAGFVGAPVRVDVPRAALHALDLVFPGGRLSGHVVYHETGAPAVGVALSVLRPGALDAATERFDVGDGTVLTDGRGAFRFEGLGEGTYEIFAKELVSTGAGGNSGRLSHLVLGRDQLLDDLVLHIGAGSSLRVSVRDGLGPRSNALVSLLDPGGRRLDLFHHSLTDDDGVATVSGVPPGRYRVLVDASASAPAVSDVLVVASGEERSLEVFLTGGVRAVLEIAGLPAGREQIVRYAVFAGEVLLRSGRAVVGAPADGRCTVELGPFLPGGYLVRLEGLGAEPALVRGEVPETGAAEWKLDWPIPAGR
jgi:hypothetical protein